MGQVLKKASNSAFRGGLTGAAAQAAQVFGLMWLRTTMNYQYRHGGTMLGVIKKLWGEGSVPRFYRGIVPALIQAPASRFGDTFANAGALAVFASTDLGKKVPLALQTATASVASGLVRILLVPIDTFKTMMQVEGKGAVGHLMSKVHANGPTVLWHGAIATAVATMVGHYPWFVTYNYLDAYLPKYRENRFKYHSRNAFIGLAAGVVSDCVSNSFRVLKTYRQTHTNVVSYSKSLKEVIAKDGLFGLFFRGLETRIVAHGINSVVFVVVWKWMQDEWAKKPVTSSSAATTGATSH